MSLSSIVMIPDDRMSTSNPYTSLLCKGLRDVGLTVHGYNGLSHPRNTGGVIHVHWPQNFAAIGSLGTALVRSAGLLAYIILRKLMGSRIVWTAHDVTSFELRHPRIEKRLMKAFVKLVDGVIYLSRSTAIELEALHPSIKVKPSTVIPHGTYGSSYPGSVAKVSAREQLALPIEAKIAAFVGDMKDYKRPWLAVEAFGGADIPDSLLLLWGAGPADIELRVTEALGKLRPELARRVIRRSTRPSEIELALIIDAIDVMLLPYRKSWNSGLGILSIERGCRIVASNQPAFLDLASEAKEYVVVGPDADLGSALRKAMLSTVPKKSPTLDRFIDRRSWMSIAREHKIFYEKLE